MLTFLLIPAPIVVRQISVFLNLIIFLDKNRAGSQIFLAGVLIGPRLKPKSLNVKSVVLIVIALKPLNRVKVGVALNQQNHYAMPIKWYVLTCKSMPVSIVATLIS